VIVVNLGEFRYRIKLTKLDFFVEVTKLVSPLIAIAVNAAVVFVAEYLRQRMR